MSELELVAILAAIIYASEKQNLEGGSNHIPGMTAKEIEARVCYNAVAKAQAIRREARRQIIAGEQQGA